MSITCRVLNIVRGHWEYRDGHDVALCTEEAGTGAGTKANDAYSEEQSAPADCTKDCGVQGNGLGVAGTYLSQGGQMGWVAALRDILSPKLQSKWHHLDPIIERTS